MTRGASLGFHVARLAARASESAAEAYLRKANISRARIIFVIGIGRSGTHFLTRCLLGHKNIEDLADGEETKTVFPLIRDAAVDLRCAPANLEVARLWYSLYATRVAPHWFLDKSHPNIWFAEYWASTFPSAAFIGILRNPYSVVSSMLRHPAIRRWAEHWDAYPIPNRFLGVSDADAYARASVVERCALRWVTHFERMLELQGVLDGRIQVVEYEALCHDPQMEIGKIAATLRLSNDFSLPDVDRSALTKLADLSSSDIRAIECVLRRSGTPDKWASSGNFNQKTV